MPVLVHSKTRRASQTEFGKVAYNVMQEAFCVHRELGRLFDEEVYLHEMARRCDGQMKVPIEVTHAGFRKWYDMDLLVQEAAIFELKTVAVLSQRHRQQLLNYLLLANMPHGKRVNFRPPSVEHEFVNTSLTLDERRRLDVDRSDWNDAAPAAAALQSYCIDLFDDLGCGLDISLYEEALVHLLGGEGVVLRRLPVAAANHRAMSQPMLLAASRTAFRVTALDSASRSRFTNHLQQLLSHLPLDYLHWINVYRNNVTFTTLKQR